MTELFPPLGEETRKKLDSIPLLIDKVFPLPGRFRAGLTRDVEELSRLLTSERGERGALYLGKPALLSAYLRYFLPWNIYRLSRLLGALPLDFKPGDAVNDFGAGPLTLAVSLWISRPEFRKIPLDFRCLDRTPAVLEAGKKLFAALSRGDCAWNIRTFRGEIRRNGTLSAPIKGKPAALSAAVNVYNELFWDFSPSGTDVLDSFAGCQARLLSSVTEKSGAVLVVEPGIPRSGEFISLLRSAFLKEGRPPVSPCTHSACCPLPGGKSRTGGKTKWCHFAFDTESAPLELRKLSAASRLPKERAVLSFICAGGKAEDKGNPLPDRANSKKSGAAFSKTGVSKEPLKPLIKIRIISDCFPVDKNNGREAASWGRYGCGESGLVLVKGDKRALESSPPGTLEELPLSGGLKDAKSGALTALKKGGSGGYIAAGTGPGALSPSRNS